MDLRSMVFILSLLLTSYMTYGLICPDRSQRRLRAQICNATHPYYTCLYDKNNERYVERCYSKSYPLGEGWQFVYREGLDGASCSKSRYQPFTFFAEKFSMCVFTKSYCNELGQVIHTDGNATTDRTCRCDYTQNFAFVSPPKSKCYCNPVLEDCSCFKKICTKNLVLSQDYECIATETRSEFSCSNITFGRNQPEESNEYLFRRNQPKEVNNEYKLTNNAWTAKYSVIVGLGLSFVGFLIAVMVTYLNDRKKTNTSSSQNSDTIAISQGCASIEVPEFDLKLDLKTVDGKPHCSVVATVTRIASSDVLTFYWFRVHPDEPGSTPIDETDVDRCVIETTQNTSSLKISDVNSTHSGKYFCKCETPKETFIKDVEIGRPEIKLIIPEESTVDAVVGSEYEIRYEVTSLLPIIQVSWEHQFNNADERHIFDGQLPNSSEDSVKKTGSLFIKDFQQQKAGTYTLYVSNAVGTASSSPIIFKLQTSEASVVLHEESDTANVSIESAPIKPDPNVSTSSIKLYYDKSNSDESCSKTSAAQVVLSGPEARKARERARQYLEEEIRIVLIGKTGVGKSSTGNTLLGSKKFKEDDSACPVTKTCKRGTGKACGKSILVIDTPGIFAINTEPATIKKEIKRCVHLASPGPHVFLFVIEYGRLREDDYKSINTFLEYFGEEMKEFVVVVFTHYDIKSEKTVEEWLDGSPDLKKFIQSCTGQYCWIDNRGSKREKENFIVNIMKTIKCLKAHRAVKYFMDESFFERAEEKMKKLEVEKEKEIAEKELSGVEVPEDLDNNKDNPSLVEFVTKNEPEIRRILLEVENVRDNVRDVIENSDDLD